MDTPAKSQNPPSSTEGLSNQAQSFAEFKRILETKSNANFLQESIRALGNSIQRTNQKTVQGILDDLTTTIEFFNKMGARTEHQGLFKSRLTFKAISEIYKIMIRRELSARLRKAGQIDIKEVMARITKQTRRFQDLSVDSKNLIQQYASKVLRDGMTVLVHGHSTCVMEVIGSAHQQGIRLKVIATHCTNEGHLVQAFCDEHKIPCKLVQNTSVGLCMDLVDCVFVGAEVVLENGGIVNKLGTFTIALCAKQFNKPFYVFAESLKFLKRFPLK